MAGFDDLIERLLHEVALTGTQGLSASQFATIVQKYYDEKNSHVTEPTDEDDDDPLFSAKPPTEKTTVDESLFGTVLEWLCKHPEVELVEVKTTATDQPNQDTPSTSTFRQKLDGKHIFVSEERVWLTLTGHGIDHKRIPPREFALLSVVAAAGPRGILQPYAGKLTDQDKRSVPKRTDMLAEKGYIVKEHVIGTGAKTTVLRLKRWAMGEQPLRSIDHPMTDPEKGGHPVIFYDAWYNTTVRALKGNRGMVAMKDLRLQLGIHGRRWETKVLMRCIKRVTESGLVRRMTARYHDKYGNPIRIAGTKRECVAHAIQLLREPTEHDRVTWRSSDPAGQKLQTEDSDGDEDDSGVEDAEGEIDAETAQGTFMADDNGATGSTQPAAALDQGAAPDDEGQVTVEDEVDAAGTSNTRIEPQWTPDLPLVNVFHRIIDEAGQKGISAMDLGSRISGPSWRRPIDQCMLLLTDVGEYSQPPHLKHLAVVRDTAVRDKFSHYRYRTRPNFDKAVAAGEATAQKLVPVKGRPKAGKGSAALDEWGFPRVLLGDLANRDGRGTLLDGRRGIQYELADDSENEDEPARAKKAAPTKTAPALDGASDEPDSHPSVTIAQTAGQSEQSSASIIGLQGQASPAIPLDAILKPTRTPKPTFKTRDLAPPSTGRSGQKRGPYRRRRPDERPVIPVLKKREIPQHEYDEFDRIAEEIAERQVLAELRASRKASQAEITLADLPSDRVAEVKEEIMARQKPGVYINPPGARTTKIENFIQLGRPRNALIAVVKSDQLKQLDWFHHDEGPRFAPKASRRRTSKIGQFSKPTKKKTPKWVENSDSEEEEEEDGEDEDEEYEDQEDEIPPPAAIHANASPQVPQIEVESERDALLAAGPAKASAFARTFPENITSSVTPTDEPPAKRRQLRHPRSIERTRSHSVNQGRNRSAEDSHLPAVPAEPSPSKQSRSVYAPRAATANIDGNSRSADIAESYEERQQAAARGLAAAMAYKQASSETSQPMANSFGLDGQQDEAFGRRSETAVPAKASISAPVPPEDLVSDDEFETVASMVGSKPQDLGPASDVDSDVDSNATEEWIPPAAQDHATSQQHNNSHTTTTKTPVPVPLGARTRGAASDRTPSTTLPDAVTSGTSSNFAQPVQPEEGTTSAAMPITTTEDTPLQAATPIPLAAPLGDALTPSQELKMLMAKPGRKSKATHARMAELNRLIDDQSPATPPPAKVATPPPQRLSSPPVQTSSSFRHEIFDKRYVEAHPDEEFHHRGGGRWARGPRDFKIRNEHLPNTLVRQAAARAAADAAPEKASGSAGNIETTSNVAATESSTLAGETNDEANVSADLIHSMPDPVYQTYSSQYVDQHPDEDFYHRGQGRWIRGLPPPGSSGKTGVRGPGAQQWKMSVLGYGVSVKPKKQFTPAVATPTMATRSSAETTTPESLIVKLPVQQPPTTDTPTSTSREEPKTPVPSGMHSQSTTPSLLNIVKPYSATSSLQIVRPYSSYASPAAIHVSASSNDGPATSAPQTRPTNPASTPVATASATPSSTPTHSRPTLKKKYKDYPEGTSDDEIFSGDPDFIVMDNLFRLAQRYTMMEIVDKINAGRPEPVSNQPTLSNRLARAISDIALRHNKPREEVVNDLRLAQQANGVPKNGRRRKTETLLKKVLQQPRRRSSTVGTPAITPAHAEVPSPSQEVPPLDSSAATAAASESQPDTPTPSLKRKRAALTDSEAASVADGTPSSSVADDNDPDDAMYAATDEPMIATSGHDIDMTDAPAGLEATSGRDTDADVRDVDEDLADPSVSLVEDSSKPSPRNLSNRGSGSIKAQRRKIILDAVRACNGVFPGDGQPWYVSATVWQRVHGQEPDRRTVDAFVQDLIGEKKLRRMVLKFKKNNEEVVRHIITLPSIDPTSQLVKDLQKKMIDAHPFVYLPPEADISEERRQKAARRYWKDDGGGHTRAGGTGTGRQPMVTFAVQQTKEAAEAEDREAREHGFGNALAYRQHRDTLAYERKAKAVAKSTQKMKMRRRSSASQTPRNDEEVAMTNAEDDVDADWELDDQPDAAGQDSLQVDQNDLDYAALELAEARIPELPVVTKDTVKKLKAKPKTRNVALKSAIRKPLTSLRPSGLGKKTRRPRDVEGSMTLDDEARHHQRAASLMQHPDQAFHSSSGTFGTAAIVTEDELSGARRLRPRQVIEIPAAEPVPELLPQKEPSPSEGRLIAEFSVPEDKDGQSEHNGVCNLNDVLRHAQSIPDVALLGESDTKTDQFFDEVDRVWYWEMQQLEQVNVNPIKAGSFINHTLNKGHTRVTHQALSSEVRAFSNVPADTVSAPMALVRLKVPGLASLGLPPGESGILGNGPPQTAEISKITGRPKRKYKSRKRKHQDVEEDARDSDPEFVPGVERDTPPPPLATRSATRKGKKADVGLAPQRDRHSGKAFKDGNRLVIAFALVAAVCGGINQDHYNWNIIAHALSFRYDGEFLRRRWGHLRRFRKGDTDRFRNALHEPFLEAYEKDELPEIDFQNLTDADWPALFEWAEVTLAPLQTAPKDDDAPEAPVLLESREATNENFYIEEPAQVWELNPDDYFGPNTDLGRKHLALRYNYGIPLSVETESLETEKDDTLLQSWVRAVALTKQANYNSDVAGKKIKQIASGKVLTRVTNAMIDSHVLVQEKKGRHLPGRNFHIHDEVLRQFRRWPVKPEWQEFQYLRMVAHAWYNINSHFQNNDNLDLVPAASDPEYLVLANMTAQGLIEITTELPEVKWNFDAPGPKLSPWGYGGANYETKRVQVQNLRFPITYKRTAAYTHNHDLRTGVPIPSQPAAVPGEPGVRIPFWVDIHGNLVDDVWDMTLRSVLHLIVFRPGVTPSAIQRSHSDKLWAWEIELLLQWMEQVGIAERWGAGEEKDGIWKGGYRASGWWYCAFLPEIATWKAPGGGDYGLG